MTQEEIAKHQLDIDKIQGQIKEVREIYRPEWMQSPPSGVKLENIQLPENVLVWGEANGKKWTPGFVASAEGPDQGLDTGSDSRVEAIGEVAQAYVEVPDQGVDTNPPSDDQAKLLLKYITAMKKRAPMLFSRNKKLRNDFKDLENYFKNKNGVVGGDKAMLDKTREYMTAIVKNKKFYSGKNSRERHEETLRNLEESQNWWDLGSSAQTISNGQEKVFSDQEIRNLLYGGNGSGSDDEEMGLDHEGISYKDARTQLWGEGEPDNGDGNYQYDAHDKMVE